MSYSRIYIAWIVSTAFFFYQYMLRGLPNILSKEIFDTFKITAEEFGSLGSIYLFTYGILQIPIGFLLDRVNLHKIALRAILSCISGALIFSISKDFYIMQVSRFILALGSATALGITLKIISSNFEGVTRSFFSGLTLTIGVLGPILGGKIVEIVLHFNSWRTATIILSLSGFILFILSFFFLSNIRHEVTSNGFKNILSQISHVFNRRIILYSVIAGGIYTPVCVFGDLWGVKFLIAKFSINQSEAIDICLSLYIGLAIGSLILPYLSEKINGLHSVIILSLLINGGLFSIIIFSESISIKNLYFLVVSIGFFCGSEMICFNAAWRIVPRDCTALTVGIINSLSLIFNGIFQHIVGVLIDMMWDGKRSPEGIRIYSEDNYVIGISSIPIVLFLSFAMCLILLQRSKKSIL